MHSRVAAVKAPRTHNRRRVTGSSGRRREGRESEPQRPNMSRRVFPAAVLLLLVVMVICCNTGGAVAADEASKSVDEQSLRRIDLFVPNQTLVRPRSRVNSWKKWGSFASPSLVSAGGVIAAFAEGHISFKNESVKLSEFSSDAVAWYIDAKWNWSTVVAKFKKAARKPQNVLDKAEKTERLDVVLRPTTVTKDNKVFLLVGSSDASDVNGSQGDGGLKLKLVVGEVTTSKEKRPSERINWGEVQSPLNETSEAIRKRNLTGFVASGGAGVLMEDGTLVFSLMAKSEEEDVFSLIIYSTDNGSTWALSSGASSAECTNPRITEWEGSLLMIVDCESGQRVYESRDMGRTWTEARGTLPGVWVNSQSKVSQNSSLHVEALITATIEGRKVMLYTQRGYALGEGNATALYVWVTDNNRSFHFGPVSMDNAEKDELASTLLYSDGNLHVLQQRDNGGGSAISLSRLTDELSAIESVLSTWAQKDIFFSNLSIPTAGLVAVLSNASANNNTWNDEYLCLNATVTNAKKVKDGVQLTDPDSRVIWSVNTRDNNLRHVFLSHNFTLVALVASVTMEEIPSGNTPLLTARLVNTGSNHTMGLSYLADKTWVTGLKGNKATQSGSWDAEEEHQVALMLQGKKGSVYFDGQLMREEEVPLTDETPLEALEFCLGACGEGAGQKINVTVKNVFLYNRPLNPTEISVIKKKVNTSKAVPESQVEGASQYIGPAGSVVAGPGELPGALGGKNLERIAATEHAATVGLTSAGSGLLPLLLLLGLWVFASS
ncbi:trans-sialidase, putative [Trypanosoma cruzi marinkellei]|uniref:Trans-sialidase, putative n=1 Tax=Trypanosoma cruzi marinkellei TaxID=85056 RepID=K2NSR8_TRYCR|nr:trans-sialidase, putative [Trypanosoma cruzi marinkellei]